MALRRSSLVSGLRYSFRERHAGLGVCLVGVVRYGSAHEFELGVFRVVGHGDRARFEDHHRGEGALHVTGIGQVGHARRLGHALDAECAVLDRCRIERRALLVQQVDDIVRSGHVAFDDELVLAGAAAQHRSGGSQDKCSFHGVCYLLLSSVSAFSSAMTRLSSSGSRLKTAEARWYCMPGRAG